MSTPVVTDSMREWAAAYVNSCQIAADAMGQPFNREKTQARIRESLTTPRRYDPRDDVEGERPDEYIGHSADDDQMADRAAEREAHWYQPQHIGAHP